METYNGDNEVLSLNKEQFNNLSFKEQLDYINSQLLEHKSLSKVCDINSLRRGTIRDRFNKQGYVLQDGQFISKGNTIPPKEITHVKANKGITDEPKSTHNTNVPKSTQSNAEHEGNKFILQLISKFKSLENKVEVMEKEIEILKSNRKENIYQDTHDQIDLEGDTVSKTFRVYKDVLVKFNTFCKTNKHYKKQDLISLALYEFMNNHK